MALCPFGVGCRPELNEMQGGGISDSASRGKGDLPFPHEDRRDVTLWRLYVFYCGRMDGGSVSGSRLAVPTGVLPGGELPAGVLPWVGVAACRGAAVGRGRCLSGCCRGSGSLPVGVVP